MSKQDFSYFLQAIALAGHGLKAIIIENRSISLITNSASVIFTTNEQQSDCIIAFLGCKIIFYKESL